MKKLHQYHRHKHSLKKDTALLPGIQVDSNQTKPNSAPHLMETSDGGAVFTLP